MRPRRWGHLLPILALVTGSLTSMLSWRLAERQLEVAEHARFDRYSERVVDTIRMRLMRQERLLEAGRGLFYASDAVSRDDWHTFVNSIDLTHYPGILGLGYIDYVPRPRLPDYLAQMRREVADFQVKTAGDYPDLYVITQIEPFDRNGPAQGLDIGKEEHRREAASQAAATGRTTLTRRVTLVQDQKKLAGFLLLMPLYFTDNTPASLDKRWSTLRGWVYQPIRIEELMSGIVEATDGMVDFEVIEGPIDDPRAMLYDADGHLGNSTAGEITEQYFSTRSHHSITQISLYGRDWRIHTSTLPEFDRTAASAFWILPIGLLLTAMATLLAWILIQARGKAERLAETMTRELRDQVRYADCLAKVRQDQHMDLDIPAFCQRIIEHVLKAMPTPADASVEIVLDDRHYLSANPVKSPGHGLASPIRLDGQTAGRISLLHLDTAGHALQAEQQMLDAVADTLGSWLERQQARAALEASTRHTQAILTNVFDGIIAIDPYGKVRTFNRAAEETFGYPQDEVIGRNVNMLMPEPYRSAHDGHLEDYRNTGIRHIIGIGREVRGQRKDGSVFPMELAVTEITEEGQHLFIGVVRDITERQQAADALAESEARFRSLYEFAPIGIALNAMDGRFLLGNRALFDMVGYTEGEFHELSYWDLTPQEYTRQEQDQLRALSDTGSYGPYEKEYLHKDGHRIPVLLQGCRISDRSGQQLILSTIMDITERKRMDRMKSEFVSTVSHELRTPLTAIRGALGLLAGGALGALPDPARELVDTAHRNSERLTVLINDLLDMEKIAAGQMRFDLQPQPVMPLVEQAIQAIQAYAEQFQVRLLLAERLDAAQVNVDAQRFQQVLSNFLSNAVKFSPAGGQVTVRVSRADARVRVTVADQGTGVPDDFRDRIFQKFSQADASDTRAKGGTGLGLAITKELAERMGGNVGFESSPGQGAKFYCDFPQWHTTKVIGGENRDG
jgi:PAS domain S-box-containing protein